MNSTQSGPMGRRRTKDLDLPQRVYRRGDSFYYVTLEGRWVPLGKDPVVMRHRWADLVGAAVMANVSELVSRYLLECMADNAENTRKVYRSYAETIRDEWGAHAPDALLPPMLAQWRDREPSKVRANGVLSLLRVAYAKGIEWGMCTTNPGRSVAFNCTQPRERYLEDAEVQAIRAELPPWGQLWLDLSYVTALRVNDVLNLRWDQVTDSVTRRSQKTNVKQAYKVEGDLALVLESARQRPILGLYVVANEKGRPIKIGRLQEAWRAACAAAKVKDAQARDMRAKSGTDAEAAGVDYQSLLGHRDARTSEIYLRNKRTVIAPTMKRKY